MFSKFEHEVREKLREELTVEKVAPASIDRILGSIFGSTGRGTSAKAPSALPLLLKKDIAAQETNIGKHLAAIQAALQLPVEVTLVSDFDWEGINNSQKDNQSWLGKPGQIWEREMGHLSKNVAKLAKTELSREAVVESWTTGQIRLIIDPARKWPDAGRPKCWDEIIVDGVLEITCNNPLRAEDQIGTWIESHL
jgi:hypothetical protein